MISLVYKFYKLFRWKFLRFFLKIFIGTILPILVISILYYSVYNLIDENKDIYILPMIYYSYGILFVPLLVYSLLVNIIVSKTDSMFYVIVLSLSLSFFMLLPSYLNCKCAFSTFLVDNNLDIVIATISGIIYGYLLFILNKEVV